REKLTALTLIALMCGKNAIPRVGGRHQAGHYTATKVAYLHGLYPLRLLADLPCRSLQFTPANVNGDYNVFVQKYIGG
ncbi:MAG: hypothetical protein SPE56_06400, partial [Prevotella sp.]|nr:hypothetical protein [Prevotella sp.]